MLECLLRFAIVVEAELVNGSVANSPGVTDVPLLESLVGDGSETGHIRSGRLKLRKGRDYVVVIEVVVEAEVLFVIDAMIELHGELVATGRLHRNSLNEIEAASGRGERDKLQQVDGGWVEASGLYRPSAMGRSAEVLLLTQKAHDDIEARIRAKQEG